MSFTIAEILGAARKPAPASPTPVQRERCAVTGKACFDSRGEAQRVAREANNHELHCNKTYRCDWCTKIHLGRRGRRS